jgi:hypothetical protein
MRDVVKCEGAVQVRGNERQERMQDAQDLEESERGRDGPGRAWVEHGGVDVDACGQ